MKKMILIAAVAVFGMTSLKAQTQVNYGVKAGPQITNLTGDDIDEAKSKIGFNVGAYANIRFSDQFAFQPELQYSMQGAKTKEAFVDVDGGSYSVEGKIKLDYINIPLMMKWYAYDGLNFEFGPQVGFNVNAKGEYDETIIIGDVETTSSYSGKIDDVQSVDFGLNIGAGYEFDNGLNLGVRYTHGLTDVVKDVKGKNSVIGFGVGYSF